MVNEVEEEEKKTPKISADEDEVTIRTPHIFPRTASDRRNVTEEFSRRAPMNPRAQLIPPSLPHPHRGVKTQKPQHVIKRSFLLY